VFITNHVLSGAVIGLAAPRRPALVALTAAGSHFALDSVPHWGTPDKRKFRRVAVVDGLCGLATMAGVMRGVPRGTRLAVFAGMLGAAFPDSDKPAEMFFHRSPFPPRLDEFHSAIQRESARGVRAEVRAAATMAAAVVVLSGARRLSARRRRVSARGPVR
jgi:hypothetical protein